MERTEKPRSYEPNSEKPLSFFDPTDLDEVSAANFFFVFSRFEYALKRARFTTLEEGKAIPNWDAFADSLDESSFRLDADQTLKDAVDYLNSNPPQKQIVKDGSLGWDVLERGKETGTQWLLLLIRRVRNNLFHGGMVRSQILLVTLHCCRAA